MPDKSPSRGHDVSSASLGSEGSASASLPVSPPSASQEEQQQQSSPATAPAVNAEDVRQDASAKSEPTASASASGETSAKAAPKSEPARQQTSTFQALRSYFFPPPKPAKAKSFKGWQCCRCREADKKLGETTKDTTAHLYCVYCPKGEQLYCYKCCALAHDWGTKSYLHTIEAIDRDTKMSLIPTAMDIIVFPLVVIWAFAQHAGIPQEYHEGRDVCPIISNLWRVIYKFDAGVASYDTWVFYSQPCNWEDGYLRLWLDMFCRCFATNGDSFFLLAFSLIRAKIFHEFVIRTLFLSAIGNMYGFVLAVARYFSEQLPPPSPAARELQSFLEKVLTQVNSVVRMAPLLGHTAASKVAFPLTKPRERPDKDFKEGFWYHYGGFQRTFKWFKDSAKDRFFAFATAFMLLPTGIRLLFLVYNFLLDLFKISGVPRAFGDVLPASFFGQPVSKDFFTGVLLESTLARGLRIAWGTGTYAFGKVLQVLTATSSTPTTTRPATTATSATFVSKMLSFVVYEVKVAVFVVQEYWILATAVLAVYVIYRYIIKMIDGRVAKQQGEFHRRCREEQGTTLNCHVKFHPREKEKTAAVPAG